MSTEQVNTWVVIPAAGSGSRMGGDTPKQYLPLAGRTVIEHALSIFCKHGSITGIYVATASQDPHWHTLDISCGKILQRVDGGEQRCHSVMNALLAMDQAGDNDWVLVHDAARPCLSRADLDHLMNELSDEPVGGLLGVAVHDTMKRTDNDHRVLQTVDRDNLWHASTPQMFRYGLLKSALASALENDYLVTDEASAMELAGHSPVMVQSQDGNIKITRADDLALAEFYLSQG
ncbi:MAG: 2-C-methyl-D-erythritol 4-phosphate cytidylyltransferase [Gammaproteobacteria bacterium]|nr:MAG: 2-C-methyl-D-erythritol 4-phosphate cytidylyltransferase [Gammaproteobacteria bacterium]